MDKSKDSDDNCGIDTFQYLQQSDKVKKTQKWVVKSSDWQNMDNVVTSSFYFTWV